VAASIYRVIQNDCRGFKQLVIHNTLEIGVYVFFLFNWTTHQVFVTYLTGALYMQAWWFYKRQHDNRVRSKQDAFSLPFAAILVNCAPSGEMHNYCTPHIIKEKFENFLIHRCNYVLLSQVYCVWQVVKTPTIILITLCISYSFLLIRLSPVLLLKSPLFRQTNLRLSAVCSTLLCLHTVGWDRSYGCRSCEALWYIQLSFHCVNPFVISGSYTSHLQRVFSSPLG
jgi:hypothetical protein